MQSLQSRNQPVVIGLITRISRGALTHSDCQFHWNKINIRLQFASLT